MLRDPGVAGYGRHAAPLSAYGPSDVHRLLPVPPTGLREVESADAGDAPVEVLDQAVSDVVVDATDVGTGDGSPGEAPGKITGFLARLRLLPAAA